MIYSSGVKSICTAKMSHTIHAPNNSVPMPGQIYPNHNFPGYSSAENTEEQTALERTVSDYWNRDVPVQAVQQALAKILQNTNTRRLP